MSLFLNESIINSVFNLFLVLDQTLSITIIINHYIMNISF